MPDRLPLITRRVVIIGFVWPEPNSSAAGQNMLGIISCFLQASWQVTFMTAARSSEHAADLRALGVSAEAVQLNCSRFDERIAQINPDVVIFDRFMTEEQFAARVRQVCPSAMRVLNTEDLHSLRHIRHQQIRQGAHATPPEAATTDDTSIREIAAILRSDLTLIISSQEMAYLQSHFPVDPSMLLHLPLFTRAFNGPFPSFEERRDFIFIGNFRHAPNWDAVLQLQQIWPQIRKQLPTAELNIFGAYPPKKAMSMDSPAKGFRVRGWAQSAAQEIARHRVMLAPLRFGAGVKGKLVTAMQCKTPSVTTLIGAEGLRSEQTWPGMVTNTRQDFIDAALTLYTAKETWQQYSDVGEQLFNRQFEENDNQQRLLDAVNDRLHELTAWRSQQFMQSLLWHQTLRATQYMTQWIEAKNRYTEPFPKAW